MAEDVFLNPSEPTAGETARRALRATMRERRRSLPVRERLDAASTLAAHLLPELAAHEGRIAGYWAVDGELPLHVIQAHLPATLRWCLPVLHEDRRLRFREWSAGQPLAPNRHGIPEPAEGALLDAGELAVVLVPLLAFDARGQRLGQGGGWYDRSFAGRTKPCLIGIGYDWQAVSALDATTWDVPLDAVATPSDFHRFEHVAAPTA